MGTHAQGVTTSTEDKVLDLLGLGIDPGTVSRTLGISVSRVSQLLSDETFALRVTERRFESLKKHNERDASYDSIEDKLLVRLHDIVEFMTKPQEILNALRIANNAKRRGSSTPESMINKQTVVKLVMPTTIVNKFVTNGHNQVIQAGSQELVTMHANELMQLTKESDVDNILETHENKPKDVINLNPGQDNTNANSELSNTIKEFKDRHALP